MNEDLTTTPQSNIPDSGTGIEGIISPYDLPLDTPVSQNLVNNGPGIQIGNIQGDVKFSFPQGMGQEMGQLFLAFFKRTHFTANHAIAWASLDTSLYNLFVLDKETYADNVFCMPKSCSIRKYTSPELQDRFRTLSDQNKLELCRMPCIFVRKNPDYKTGSSYPALLGRLTDIEPQTYNIKLKFEAFQATVEQQLLNKCTRELGIMKANLRNELDVEHWGIKKGNLIAFTSAHGISVT